MHSRAVRIGLVALLFASAAGVAALWWQHDVEAALLDERLLALDVLVERTRPAAAEITSAQRAYVDYGLRDEGTFRHIEELIPQITSEAARLRLGTTSSAGTEPIDRALEALATLSTAAAEARRQFQAGEPLAAAETLLGAPGQEQAGQLAVALREYQSAEMEALRDRRTALDTQLKAAVGGVALLWAAAVVTLARRSRTPPPAPAVERPAAALASQPVPPSRPPAKQPAPLDVVGVAEICRSIGMLTDAAGLPAVLDRAAGLLGARGLVLWMGAGDKLLPAGGAGFDRAVMQRLRPIPRSADNATAVAWRTGTLRTVAGDTGAGGAIVAPMCTPDGCVGVLAAEVRNGSEADASAQAAAAIIAAQLSGVLAASASAAPRRAGGPAAAGGTRESERNSAAL